MRGKLSNAHAELDFEYPPYLLLIGATLGDDYVLADN